nr:SDR family oxidoreductase [Kibdelosporangium sp. MJ126-NF4]CEL19953.1 Short-chain dehydrogenase/reductase SDR [Kibdelosporangium sp. MJ126-NF4]CTQ97177.1 Short-chain dehydrogenase/reductase SDR [Kibdelosporangium sp. MJ126-NF4]
MSDAKVLLVTGGTGALGESVVRHLASEGHQVLVTGRNEEKLGEIVAAHGNDGQVQSIVVDATTPLGARKAVSTTVENFGRIDGLVHLVGGFRIGPVALTDADAYEHMIKVNFISAVTAAQATLPQLSGSGHMVFVGSVLAEEPLPGFSAYGASKAALFAWAKSFAHEVKHKGVHVNTVMMTMADTPDSRAQRPHVDFSHAVTPDVVAKVIQFLVSPQAEGLYGVTVPVLGQFELNTPLTAPPPGMPPLHKL